MSDHSERACTKCGSLLHHEEDCTPARAEAGVTQAPRSDAEELRILSDDSPNGCPTGTVPIDFARTLERELGEARNLFVQERADNIEVRRLLADVGASHAEGLRHVQDQERELIDLRAQLDAEKARVAEAQAELSQIDAYLARRPALDCEQTRFLKIRKAIETARGVDTLRQSLARSEGGPSDARANLTAQTLFRQLGGRLITRVMEAADMSLPDSSDVELQLVRLLTELSTLRDSLAKAEQELVADDEELAEMRNDSSLLNWLLKKGLAWNGCYEPINEGRDVWGKGEWLYAQDRSVLENAARQKPGAGE